MQYLIAAFWSALIGVVGYCLQFLMQFMTRKVATTVIYLALFTTLTTAYILSISALVSIIQVSMPQGIQTAATWIMPSNFSACLSVYVSARTIRWAYRRNLIAASISSGTTGKGWAW